MRGFSVNIEGRVKNFKLPKNQPLIPLYEAIVNSFHAIEERKRNDNKFFEGNIIVNALRDTDNSLHLNGVIPDIIGFEIIDNGVGFNESNMSSFLVSDSTYKAEYGGKGVGRFSWLTVFKDAQIESVFKQDNEFVIRKFTFSTKTSEIDDLLEPALGAKENSTKITLNSPNSDYIFPKQGNTIAMRIIQHCLIYFMAEDCPNVVYNDGEEKHELNTIFHQIIKTDNNEVAFKIGDEEFKLLHVQVEDKSMGGNKLFLCANNRLVDTKELEKYIVDLDKGMYKRYGFWYIGVLTSNYLDKNVDMNRVSFSIPEGGGIADFYVKDVTIRQIMESVIEQIKIKLNPYLSSVTEAKEKHIKNYVTQRAPQYRHLLRFMKEDIANIKPDLTEENLDDELYKIKRKFDLEIKEQNQKLIEELNNGILNKCEYETRFNKQIKKVNAANSATLAEYIAHRKVIIDLLEMGIKKNEDGKFQKEKFIHNLIYPMRKNSDEESYDNHNLWLIDEKLAYSNYISSDIPFSNDNKQERTDIMVLDNPVAVSDIINEGSFFDTITLFELKRPMRNDYTDNDNPITQLFDYVDKILSGEARDKAGRPIKANENTKFYLYAVCDVTPKLYRILRQRGFNATPDGMGYFLNNSTYNAYVEVLPFDKMINDSKKRNRVLFEKLGL